MRDYEQLSRAICGAVGTYFGVAPGDVMTKRRVRDAVRLRDMALYFAYRKLPIGRVTIARLFNAGDHCNVVFAVRKVEFRARQDAAFQTTIDALDARVAAALAEGAHL